MRTRGTPGFQASSRMTFGTCVPAMPAYSSRNCPMFTGSATAAPCAQSKALRASSESQARSADRRTPQAEHHAGPLGCALGGGHCSDGASRKLAVRSENVPLVRRR